MAEFSITRSGSNGQIPLDSNLFLTESVLMALRQVRARMPPTGLSDSLSWVGIVVVADLAGPGLLQGTLHGKVEWLNHV